MTKDECKYCIVIISFTNSQMTVSGNEAFLWFVGWSLSEDLIVSHQDYDHQVITTNLHFLPHRTQTQRSPKARSPIACTHIITRAQINRPLMDVLPAHLNRDSFRDSLKGLVASEIIIDLPFGFPINNIISLINYVCVCLFYWPEGEEN